MRRSYIPSGNITLQPQPVLQQHPHIAGAPDPISRNRRALGDQSLAPNIFFRACVRVYVRAPSTQRKPPAEGITTAAIAFQPKACRPLTPALGLVSEEPLAQTAGGRAPGMRRKKTQPSLEGKPNPGPKTHFPPGDSEGPVGREVVRGAGSSRSRRRAECHADSARLKNNKKGPHHAQCASTRQTDRHEALQERAGKRLEVCNIIGRV